MQGISRILLSALVALAVSSNASDIKDHASITSQAVDFFESCFPKKLSQFTKESLIFANSEEDLNLIRKWVKYSHFYSPTKDVATWRGTSMNRVRDAEDYLENFRSNLSENFSVVEVRHALFELGHIIHHLQDSAVPTHVVPVKHWIGDSFEAYKSDSQFNPIICSEIIDLSRPSLQLHFSAVETWQSLQQSFEVKANSVTRTFNWHYFWYDNGGKFGSYGYFGNRFGQSLIKTSGGVFEISPQVYNEFWQQRRRQSVVHSARALYWFFSKLLVPMSAKSQLESSANMSLQEILFEPF